MKHCFSLLILLMLSSVVAFGQIRQVGTESHTAAELRVKEKFDRTTGLIDPRRFKPGEPPSVSTAQTRGKPVFGPGDIPLFLLHVNKSFVRKGEVVEFNLVPMQDSELSYYVSGRIFKPGYVGYFDGSERVGYFGAEVGAYGNIRGTRVGDWYKVHTRMFNQEDSNGWFQIDFVVWDDQGNLVQQLWAYLYLADTGPINPWNFIGDVRIQEYSLTLQGQFPTEVPIYYMIGIPKNGFLMTGPDPNYAAYASPNGRRVELNDRVRYPYKAAVDVMTWSPGSRQAILGPQALVEEAYNPY